MANNNKLNDVILNAVKEKQIDVVKDYLESKQKANLTDWAGHTCLHLAVLNGDIEMTRLLLNYYVGDVFVSSKFQKTPLHLACQNGYFNIAETLILNGSNINAQDMLKMTPLHWSIERGHLDIVKLLLKQKNINLHLIDKFERSCFDIATKNKNEAIIQCLNEKIKENESLSFTNFDLDFISSEINSELVSNKPTSSSELEEHMNSLEEFYKKRTFAKSLSSKNSNNSLQNIKLALTNESLPKSSTSDIIQKNQFDSIPINSKIVRPKWAAKNWDSLVANDEISDDDRNSDDDSSDDEYERSKKKRLSMSPLNKIEDTLFWLKDQSKKSSSYFDNKEISLTEAGLLTLEYLNKNDPIRQEKSLFMKLCKEIEEEEKSNVTKPPISAISSNEADNSSDDLDNISLSLPSSLSSSVFDMF